MTRSLVYHCGPGRNISPIRLIDWSGKCDHFKSFIVIQLLAQSSTDNHTELPARLLESCVHPYIFKLKCKIYNLWGNTGDTWEGNRAQQPPRCGTGAVCPLVYEDGFSFLNFCVSARIDEVSLQCNKICSPSSVFIVVAVVVVNPIRRDH